MRLRNSTLYFLKKTALARLLVLHALLELCPTPVRRWGIFLLEVRRLF